MSRLRAATARQLEVLAYIHRVEGRTGVRPSMRRIAGALGVSSTSTVFKHVTALRKKGFLK